MVSYSNCPKQKLFLKIMRLHPVLRAVASEPLDTASCGQRPMDGIFSWNNCRIVDPEFCWYEISSSIEVTNGVSDPRLSFHGDIAFEVLRCHGCVMPCCALPHHEECCCRAAPQPAARSVPCRNGSKLLNSDLIQPISLKLVLD